MPPSGELIMDQEQLVLLNKAVSINQLSSERTRLHIRKPHARPLDQRSQSPAVYHEQQLFAN